MGTVEKTISAAKGKDSFAYLSSGVRSAVFELQGLARAFDDYPDKKLAEFAAQVRTESKSLEDALGSVDKYKTVNQPEKMAAANLKAMTLLNGRGWIATDGGPGPIFKNWITTMEKLDWPSDKDDRAWLLGEMADQLKKVENTEYDMNLLEGGMHEFRRQLRWFSIYASVTDGLLQKTDKGEFACKQDPLPFKEFADPRYVVLKSDPSVRGVCYISTCLYDEIVGVIGVIGKIKDKAEAERAATGMDNNDINPPAIATQAVYWHSRMISAKILKHTRKQIEACL